MHPKRGQITTFIIIGVVLIAVVGVLLYTRSASVPKEEAGPADVAPIKLYVEQCLKSTVEDAVLTVAAQGGYYFAPQNSINFLYMSVPYYLYEGRVLVPTKEAIEGQLAIYVMLNLPQCVDLESFRNKGYNITAEILAVKTTIREKEVLFDVNYSIVVRIEGQEQAISEFSTDVKAEFMKLYNAAKTYTNYQKEDQTGFLVSRLVDITYNSRITFETLTFDDEVAISLKENSTTINNRPLIFTFAIKYLPAEIDETLMKTLSLNQTND